MLNRTKSVADTLDALVSLLDQKASEHSVNKSKSETERYPYIPLSRTVFLHILFNIKRLFGNSFLRASLCDHCGSDLTKKVVFVDVGCGLADKVALANQIGFEAHGIEVDPYLVRMARRNYTFNASKERRYSPPLPARAWIDGVMTVYEADALTFNYSGFEVIYFYRPLSSEKLQKKLERRIWRQAIPGAFVIACSSVTKPPADFALVTDWDAYQLPGSRKHRCLVAGSCFRCL